MKVPYFIGVWCTSYVAPLVGAWIESVYFLVCVSRVYVAPLVGAWIERLMQIDILLDKLCRSSCRSVD